MTCEATPHHFALADQDMAPYDSNYKMKPPLRSAGDRAAVVEGLAAGAVSAIATDHAPHPGSEKMQEFERCPFGIIGLETALALALEELVHPGKITLNRMVELFTTGPERRLAPGPGHAGARRPRRRDGFQHGFELDLRREPVVLAQPEFAIPRADVPRRPGGDGSERPVRVEARVTGPL